MGKFCIMCEMGQENNCRRGYSCKEGDVFKSRLEFAERVIARAVNALFSGNLVLQDKALDLIQEWRKGK